MVTERGISWIVSEDGRRRMRVVKSSVGELFYFEEQTYRFEDDEYVQVIIGRHRTSPASTTRQKKERSSI
jgi:hypothetical protein